MYFPRCMPQTQSTYLGILLIVLELQHEVLFALAQVSDRLLLYVCIHQVPLLLLASWQVASNYQK